MNDISIYHFTMYHLQFDKKRDNYSAPQPPKGGVLERHSSLMRFNLAAFL